MKWAKYLCMTGLVVASPLLLAAQVIDYPVTPKSNDRESRFGVHADDPYRWLENDVRVDPQVRNWVDAQNRLTETYISDLPARQAIKQRLNALWNYERFSIPRKSCLYYFFTRNSGLQNQASLYVQRGLHGAAWLLLDPHGWAEDGATALADWAPSNDGRYIAFATQVGGTDWRSIRLLDVASGTTLGDRVDWVKFSYVAWNRAGTGFYYSRFPEPQSDAKFYSPDANQSVHFHRIGTSQSADKRIYATPDKPAYIHLAETSQDGRWLVVRTRETGAERFEVHARTCRAAEAHG